LLQWRVWARSESNRGVRLRKNDGFSAEFSQVRMRSSGMVLRKFASVVCAAYLFAAPLYAGSTTSLHTPQGADAATNNGDFVTSEDGGPPPALDTYYSYFVEVPPNLTSLQIQIFDADIGAGPADEDDNGRDRNRNAYETEATYSLINPANVNVTPRFTAGTNALPAGADNNWLTFYGVGNSVRDNFTTAAFTNNDGTADWAAAWIETDGGGAGAGAGAVQVTGGELRIADNVGGTPQMQREVDLLGFPGLDLTAATFTYSYRTSGNLEAGDSIRVEVSNNGGGAWTTLATLTDDVTGTGTHNITTSIANNTRIRFIVNAGYNEAGEFFFVDNVQISDNAAAPAAGHWEVRIRMDAANLASEDDINALGIRASDGDWTATGTELNVYADSYLSLGVNPDTAGGNARVYTLYPWVTSGCSFTHNDFDRDSNQVANIGNAVYTGRINTFTQTVTDPEMSTDDAWADTPITGYTTNDTVSNYGIWTVSSTINTYDNNTGNYETLYLGNNRWQGNPPAPGDQPLVEFGVPAAHRIYLPTDAGTAPVKPYLQQFLTVNGGPQPPAALGVMRTYTVNIFVQNPTAYDINFSATNVVRANVPGSGTVYAAGFATVTQGTVLTQPVDGGTGDVTWNPGTVLAGTSAKLSYHVRITPAAATTNATGDPAGGVPAGTTDNGTRATYVDETGNAAQARATARVGGLCQLRVVVGALTEVALAQFEVDGRGRVRWVTASEAGTVGFNLYREDGSKVNEGLIPAGKRVYTIDDRRGAETYILEEITATGRSNRHGPLITGRRLGPDVKTAADEPIRQLMAAAEARFEPVTEAAKTVAVMAGVRETGLVRVPFAELATRFGRAAAAIQQNAARGDIAVTTGGVEVAWTAAADAIVFFGEKPDSIYSNERTYRITLDRGVRMASMPVTLPVSRLSSSLQTENFETDAFAATSVPLDPEGDYWFWDYIVSGDPSVGRKTFNLDIPALAHASGASLEVRLQGALDNSNHTARVKLNGVPVGELAWKNLAARHSTIVLPSGVLRDGANAVEVEGVLGNSQPFDIFYVDGFAVRYTRLARTINGAVEAAMTGPFTAAPFNAQPMALDITKRTKPILLTGGSFKRGEFSMTIPGTAKGGVFVSERFINPTSYRSAVDAQLRNQRADYVIVAPAAMRSGAEALARLRQGDGLRTFVADLESVYDEFSFGARTPHAIRAYVGAALKLSTKPRYFVLAGTGSLDYRGLTMAPGPMPPMMVRTPDGIYASDTKIADANNNGIPDLAIGRIPVTTNAELLAYVEKLRVHTASTATNPTVFSSDFFDASGTDFRRANAESAHPLLTRPMVRLDLDEVGAEAAREGLLDAWQAGTPLVSWIGHGGNDQIANSGILTAGDVPALLHSGRLPILVAMTCTINRFEITPIVEPLGSALTRDAQAGALAVWSATGLSNHENARELQKTFMKFAAQKPQLRVGELIVLAHAANPSDTAGIYVLLGDPAVALELPKETTNVGPGTPTGE
jgi:Peptidase family C25